MKEPCQSEIAARQLVTHCGGAKSISILFVRRVIVT